MYTSTRKPLNFKSYECILKGISDDGGLFITTNFKDFKIEEDLKNKTYQELALIILKFFFNEFSDAELDYAINSSYNSVNFKEKIVDVKTFGNLSFLELFYGPTMAFKDMALTLLPYLMELSKKKIGYNKKTCILTATSGDTGGACLSGFYHNKDSKVIVLYPTKGVSKFQEKQMHYYTNDKNFVFSIDGNFDDCQTLVKKVFTTTKNLKNISLSSANSINIGRLVPQIIYYFYSYFTLVKQNEIKYGDKINFCVPTGNFGNILACYIAKLMGLPIKKIVCASNENNVLTEFFKTLTYDKNRSFHVTLSPAMDILISSNLERLLYLITDGNYDLINSLMNDLNTKGKFTLPIQYKEKLNDFYAYSIDDLATLNYIQYSYDRNHYLIDPHTAVSYGAYLNLKDKLPGKTIVVATASPYKFIDTVNKVFKINKEGKELALEISKITNTTIPSILNEIYDKEVKKEVWKKDEMEEKLRKFIGELDEIC